MGDGPNVETFDAAALAEIEMVANLMIAARTADGQLTNDEIDVAIGLP